MPITIIGAGAIGGVIGAYLIRNGEGVVFVDRDEAHINAINENGLTIQLKNEAFTVEAKAFTPEKFIASHPYVDAVFLAVKAQHTKEAIEPFEPLMKQDSFVVSFQNGLCEYDIAEVVGAERTVGCFVNLFADYIEPGRIEYGGVGSLFIGEINGTVSERVTDLRDRLQCWGEAKETENIFGYLWSKLAYGAMLTATATTNNEIADFFENPQFHGVLNALGTEVLKVAEKQGVVPEPFDDWNPALLYPQKNEQKLQQSYFQLAKRLRGYTKTRSGIWRDLAVRKRKTEVPQHLNPIIRIGEEHGLELPITCRLLSIIQDIETGQREMGMDNIRELESLMQESEIS
ncbi:ketopantoate reductase family protein [Planomicrobium sp. CPCC 101110]|uniref:ketopantoate reductase family protein n=1 Tax=Planomicrobium sp. CPCC 101110 TaxID=2599619 RepID=UPI0011B62B5E|nr:2-dehydropantoate 2-reductase [Planomicrobium sp. CPCC 101110]TWT25351.1 ketopantoate reductase family protein [Planomicrobium sp. CPCC 101110]